MIGLSGGGRNINNKHSSSSAKKNQPSKLVNSGRPQKADWRSAFVKKHVGLEDMTLLTKVSNEDILRNLQVRHSAGQIYTYIGHVLISVNPYQDVGLYSDKILQSYRGRNRIEMPPHVYAIAETAFRQMADYNENQCVIISGESGAGKTENAKKILQYLASVSNYGTNSICGGAVDRGGNVKQQVLSTNPLLESFGNAKTLRNDNSSRFGKYLEVEFDSTNSIVGAKISNFLLEKSRVTFQSRGERNFHILYQLTRGASEAERNSYSIYGPEDYNFTAAGKCVQLAGVDDAREFEVTRRAMSTVGIGAEEQQSIIQALAAVLWLGNVRFAERQDCAQIENADVLNMAAFLLDVTPEALSYALCNRLMEAGSGSHRATVYHVPLNAVQANAARNALAQSIYGRLFDWIIDRTNRALQCHHAQTVVKSVGILDIYGFEIFDQNHFEQLCVNYVNEKLQQIFVQLTLKSEQEEYVEEGIRWNPIDYFNNKIVCDLIEEKRPPGIFAILNDVVATAHADCGGADRSLVQRLAGCTANPHFQLRGHRFCIRHYAGDVLYETGEMSEKNKDQLGTDLVELMKSSTRPFYHAELFPETAPSRAASATDRKRLLPSASDRIKQSADKLVQALMCTQPSYIRCIKPNEIRSAVEFDGGRSMHQIKYLGLLENLRVRRAGYCNRELFGRFVERFYLLSRHTSYAGEYIWKGDQQTACMKILQDSRVASDEWQLGRSKVFIRHPETLWALEHLRQRFWHNMAARIQRLFRALQRRRLEAAMRIQRAWRQWRAVRRFIQLRDYGHSVYGQRKERRRFSLVSQRRFMGDYLVHQPQIRSRLLQAAGVRSEQSVVFLTDECRVLAERFLRSPVMRNCFLLLTTNGKLTLMEQQDVNGPAVVLQTTLIRSIVKLSASTLCDDFLVIHLSGGEQQDLVLQTVFKTELCTHLMCLMNGQLRVDCVANGAVDLKRKSGKRSTLRFVHQQHPVSNKVTQKGWTVTVMGSGESPAAVSNPRTAFRRATAAQNSRRQPTRVSEPRRSQQQLSTPTIVTSSSKLLYKALYDYVAQRPDELSFSAGQEMELVEKDEFGWFLVSLCLPAAGKGWVPSNYLEELFAATPSLPPRRPPPVADILAPTIKSASKITKPPPMQKLKSPPPMPKLKSSLSSLSQSRTSRSPSLPDRRQLQPATTIQKPAHSSSGNAMNHPPVKNLITAPKQPAALVAENVLNRVKLKPVGSSKLSAAYSAPAASPSPLPSPLPLMPKLKPSMRTSPPESPIPPSINQLAAIAATKKAPPLPPTNPQCTSSPTNENRPHNFVSSPSGSVRRNFSPSQSAPPPPRLAAPPPIPTGKSPSVISGSQPRFR